MIDLFSGLGGASQPFLDRGWLVYRIDNNPEFEEVPYTIIADVQDMVHFKSEKPDLIWASPPCIEFTKASLPKTWKCNIKNPPNPDTELLKTTISVIKLLKPRYWVIENVRGAVKYFKPILGKPTKKVGSRYLWGEFPIFDVKPQYGKWKLPPTEDRPKLRSLIPYALSNALAIAIEKELEEVED